MGIKNRHPFLGMPIKRVDYKSLVEVVFRVRYFLPAHRAILDGYSYPLPRFCIDGEKVVFVDECFLFRGIGIKQGKPLGFLVGFVIAVFAHRLFLVFFIFSSAHRAELDFEMDGIYRKIRFRKDYKFCIFCQAGISVFAINPNFIIRFAILAHRLFSLIIGFPAHIY